MPLLCTTSYIYVKVACVFCRKMFRRFLYVTRSISYERSNVIKFNRIDYDLCDITSQTYARNFYLQAVLTESTNIYSVTLVVCTYRSATSGPCLPILFASPSWANTSSCRSARVWPCQPIYFFHVIFLIFPISFIYSSYLSYLSNIFSIFPKFFPFFPQISVFFGPRQLVGRPTARFLGFIILPPLF